jgi:hypothetical protein
MVEDGLISFAPPPLPSPKTAWTLDLTSMSYLTLRVTFDAERLEAKEHTI